MAIIDGRQWRREREQHLRASLATGDMTDDQRAAIEAELSALSQEAHRDRRHWWHWVFLGTRPPGR